MHHQSKGKMKLMQEKKICVQGKHEGHFFENVLSEVIEKGYLKEMDMERMQMELIQIWTKQIEGFNSGRSSSITETNAKKLLESIYFTLGFRLRGLNDLDDSIILLQEKNLEDLFEEGQTLIRERLESLKEEYKTLQDALLETQNIAYRDTYDRGLAPFFTSYLPEYASQECPANIDYPLSNDKMEKVGMDYMIDYIEKSLLEHSLCLKFKFKEVEEILEGYHKGYRDLLINIFELLLMNAIGRLIVDKDLSSIQLEVLEIKKIQEVLEVLPTPFLNKLLMDKGMEVLEQLDLKSTTMCDYTAQTIAKFVQRIEVAIEEETLDKIFIPCKQEEQAHIQYIAGKRLEDEAFKSLTETIRACEKIEDKIQWIKEKVHHIEDLRDILEADCFFNEEYNTLYEKLEDIEIALLLYSIRVDENDLIDIELDREWFDYLKQYLEHISVSRQEAIKKVAREMI